MIDSFAIPRSHWSFANLRSRHFSLIAIVLGVVFCSVSTAVGQQFDKLLPRVPGDANSIVLIDVEGIYQSELATKENWKDQHAQAYVERPIILPPEADQLVMASNLDLGNDFRSNWDVAVMNMTEPIGLRSIARSEGGYLDTINEVQAAWSPSDAYFMQVNNLFAVIAPANRQFASRWIDFARRNQTNMLSTYLSAAASQGGPKSQVVMAIDLKDAIRPHLLEERLNRMKALEKHEDRKDGIAAVIKGIQGVTLTLTVDRDVSGKLRIDFAEDVRPIGALAKPMILETIEDLDAELPDVEQWRVRTEGKSIIMEGQLSESGQLRVFSLFELPSTRFTTLEDVTPSSDDDVIAKASLTYFRSVQVLIDDLRKTLDDTRDNHAVWMERYARKVDNLPVLNVDPELLEWGAKVGETFRNMALAKRGAGVRTGVRSSQVYGNYTYSDYNNNGYYWARPTTSVQNQIRTEERARATEVRFTNWNAMENATREIRTKMTQKYQMEF